jgi:hypothetical protein
MRTATAGIEGGVCEPSTFAGASTADEMEGRGAANLVHADKDPRRRGVDAPGQMSRVQEDR